MTGQDTFKSSLDKMPIPEVLSAIYDYKVGGMLTVSHKDIEKRIFFEDEYITFASSNIENDRLGEYLVRVGKIKQVDYDNSVKILKKTGKRQGQIFVDIGCLTAKELYWAVKSQTKEIAFSLFLWTEGKVEFIPGNYVDEETIKLRIRIVDLIIEGIKRIQNPRRFVAYLGGKNAILKVASDGLKKMDEKDLGSECFDIYNMIDGKTALEDLVSSTQKSSIEFVRTLYILKVLGALKKNE